MSSDSEREAGLEDLVLQAAQERCSKTLNEIWDEVWQDKEAAAKIHEEDGGREHQFKYRVNLPVIIHPKGSGNVEVSVKARWSVVKTCELPAGKVGDHPELPLGGEAKEEPEEE